VLCRGSYPAQGKRKGKSQARQERECGTEHQVAVDSRACQWLDIPHHLGKGIDQIAAVFLDAGRIQKGFKRKSVFTAQEGNRMIGLIVICMGAVTFAMGDLLMAAGLIVLGVILLSRGI
jgi:hypothetical protein